MINSTIAIILCLLSMVFGGLLAAILIYVVLMWPEEYTEKDDFPNAEWAKDYEEIKNGH